MKQHIILLIIGCLALGYSSCKKDDDPPTGTDPEEENSYVQYGIPFAQVPEIEDIIMYEINLRAFSATGDIPGIINRLEDIEALGVNVIWLMPIHPIGQINSVNSPYSVSDHKQVSAEYGTLADLRNLTDQAHARGIAVMMDWVANHTAWDNEWIQKNRDWYTQDQDGRIVHPPGTNWMDVADLNFDKVEMRAAMIDAMKYWVYEANIDGFRCDYADGVPFDFWQQAWQALDSIPNRELIYFAEGNRTDHFAAGFDLNFGWQSYGALKDVFNGEAVSKIFTAHENEYHNIQDGKHWIRFTTNHDESAWDATPISIFNGIDGALVASVISIFTGGVPLIYGSQEVGTSNNIPFFSNSTINWDQNPELLGHYQKILQFYSANPVARTGQNTLFPHPDVACFKKSAGGEEVVIIANLRNASLDYHLPAALQNTSWTDIIQEGSLSLGDQLSLSPYQFYILD